MRDFVSGFAAGLSRGLPVGLAYGEKVQERKRKAAEDKATAAYRTSQAAEAARHNKAVEGTSAGTAAETARHNLIAEGTAARTAATGERNATAAEYNASTLADYRRDTIAGKVAENEAKYMELARKMGWNPGVEAKWEESIPGYVGKTYQEFLKIKATDAGTAAPAPAPEQPAPTAGDAALQPMQPPMPPTRGYAFGGVVQRDPRLRPEHIRPDRIRQGGALGRPVAPLAPMAPAPRAPGNSALKLPRQVMQPYNTGSVPPSIGLPAPQDQPLEGYADGGLVTDNRETTIAKAPAEPLPTTALGSPKTPPGKLRIAKDQSRLGGELSETLRDARLQKAHKEGLRLGIEALAEEAAMPAPAPAAGPAPSPGGALAAGKTSMGGPDQAGQVQSAFKGEPALTTEEWEASLKKVDPENKLPEHMKEIKMLAVAMDYYNQAGMPEEAKKFAKSLLDRSRLIAATYGGAAEASLQKGEYSDALNMLTEGWNNHVPDGSTLLVSENGMVVLRDANGKVQAEYEPTPENLMAGAMGLKDGSAWFEAVTRTAGEALTPAQEAKAATAAPKSGQLNSRLKLDKVFRDKPEDKDGPAATGLITTAMDAPLMAAGVDPADPDVAKRIKPVREAVQNVATELVMGSDGSTPPEAAADIAAKLLAIDPEDPTRSPFQVRLNRDKKTKKPTTLDLLIDGEVYSLPHQSLPQVKKIIQFQQEQAALVAERTATAKAAADAQAATDLETSKAAQQRNEGFGAAIGSAADTIGTHLGRAGEQLSRVPETLSNLRYTPSMPDLSGAAGWLKRQIPTTEGKKLNQRP